MKKILFVIAMEKEAIDLANKLGLVKIEENERNSNNSKIENRIYRKENITLIITGIGKQCTAINLVKYLEKGEKPDIIINMGYAGSTNSNIGSWVNINASYNYEWEILGEEKYSIKGLDEKILQEIDFTFDKINNIEQEKLPIKNLPCYSSESFVTKTDIKEDVLFDMELHSIYLICQIYGIKLISLKKVSDNLNLNDYYKNIEMKNVMELTSGLEILKDFISEI